MCEKISGQPITATELKKNLGKYLDHVMADNEVVVTKNGNKAIRLTPYLTDYDRYLLLKERATDYLYGRKKVSYEEFMEINENTDLRMEYIDGEIVLLSSPNAAHQEVLGSLYAILREFFKGSPCKVFLAPFDVHFYKPEIKDPDLMQPDIIVACDAKETINENGRYMGTPTLTIEILSASTRSKDMVNKLNTYMLSGAREYWVIDPEDKTVLAYGFEERGIAKVDHFKENDTLHSYAFDELSVDLNSVFAEI
jgi:prevent-host-death family protein